MTSTSNPNINDEHRHRRERHYAPTTSSLSASLKGCCCCLFLLLTFLALLTLGLALILVLVVKPKKPEFQLRQVAVSYLLITQPTSSPTATAYLSLNITMLFAAANPNKIGIKYEMTGFYVMYRGVPLGTGSIPGFEQPAHSSRLIETRVAVSRVNVLQTDAIELMRDAVVDDRIELRVLGDVGAKIRVLSLTSPKVQVSVDCKVLISPSKQTVTSTQCGVDGVNV